MNKKALTIYEITAWLLVALCVAAIMSLSSQDGEQSQALSYEVTDVVIKLTKPDGPIDRSASDYLQKHDLIRKLAHACEYALLGFFLMAAIAPFKPSLWKKILLAVGLCVVLACVDEWRQSFVSGRGGEFADVLTDTAGALTGCTVALAARGVLLLAAERGAFWRMREYH